MFQACLDREIKSAQVWLSDIIFSKHFEQLVASTLQFGQLPVNTKAEFLERRARSV
jgi:hypothetical protein